ncbi:MAG: DUF7577 domain-containing protein [Candidatus Heimdallarchaeota archaeon]
MTDLKVIYCQSCGEKNEASAKFCNECGKPFGQQGTVVEKESEPADSGSALGVVSLTTGILGFCCLPGIGWIIAIITGFLTPNARENSYAKAGISIGVFVLCFAAFGGSVFGLGTYFSALANEDVFYPAWLLIFSIIGILLVVTAMVFFIRWLRKKSSPT